MTKRKAKAVVLHVIDVKLMLWKWEGAVVVGGTGPQFAEFAKRYDITIESGHNAAGHAHVEYGKPFLIWVDSLKNVAALAHEALHTTCGILEARGLKFSDASEEAYTYTMEDIIRQTLDAKNWTEVKP